MIDGDLKLMDYDSNENRLRAGHASHANGHHFDITRFDKSRRYRASKKIPIQDARYEYRSTNAEYQNSRLSGLCSDSLD